MPLSTGDTGQSAAEWLLGRSSSETPALEKENVDAPEPGLCQDDCGHRIGLWARFQVQVVFRHDSPNTLEQHGNSPVNGRNPIMTITAEQLLQHSQWAHALARHLVGDAAEADDIVQDAWLAAIQEPPLKGALRPWLGGVIHNLARMRHRSEYRRKDREAKSAKTEALPTTSELVERAESQRLLVDAVLKLPEPYRSVVLLRYFDNSSAAEIARDRSIPAGTVRSQLHEGLAKLRLMLDSQHGGDRRAWCVALLPLARVEWVATAGISSSFLTRWLLMNTTTKTTTALASIAILALAFVAFGPTQPRDANGPTPAPAPIIASLNDTESPPVARSQLTGSERDKIQTDDTDSKIAYALRARFVDANRQPLQGVRFVITGTYGIGSPACISDDNGIVVIQMLVDPPLHDTSDPNDPHKIRVSGRASRVGLANEFVTARLIEDVQLDLGEISLSAGGSIHGTVQLESGQPAIDAEVWSLPRFESTGRAVASTDKNGAFHLKGVLSGTAQLTASVTGLSNTLMRGKSAAIRVRPNEDVTGVIIVAKNDVPRERLILGVVLDAQGAPVPSAQVRTSTSLRHHLGTATADSQGRFAIESDTPQHGLAFDPSNRWRVDHVPEVVPGRFHEFHLRDPGEMKLIVCDARGEAVTDAQVSVQHSGKPGHRFTDKSISIDGGRILPRPQLPFLVSIIAEGYRNKIFGPYDPATMSDEQPTLTCELETAMFLRGVVQAGGAPVAGASIRIHSPARQRSAKHGFPLLVNAQPVARTTSDSEGRFEFALGNADPFSFHLLVSAKGYALTQSGEHPPSRLLDANAISITLSKGGSLAGKVSLSATDNARRPVIVISRGDGVIRTQRVNAGGRYRFDYLTPGPWIVRKFDQDITLAPDGLKTVFGKPFTKLPSNCELFEGHLTTYDFGDVKPAACELTGRVRLGDLSIDGWRAELRAEGLAGGPSVRTPLENDGRFALRTPIAGRYQLMLGGRPDGAVVRIQATLTLKPGKTDWTFDHDAAEVTVQTVRRQGQPARRLVLRWHDGEVLFLSPIRFGPDGQFKVTMPKGKVDVVHQTSRSAMGPLTWPLVQSCNVTKDQILLVPE